MVRAAGEEALLVHTFPIDVALIPVAFMEGSAAIAMNRDAMTMARAAQSNGGLVIGQATRMATLDRLPPGQVVVPDTLLDLLIAADETPRAGEVFATPAVGGRSPFRGIWVVGPARGITTDLPGR